MSDDGVYGFPPGFPDEPGRDPADESDAERLKRILGPKQATALRDRILGPSREAARGLRQAIRRINAEGN